MLAEPAIVSAATDGDGPDHAPVAVHLHEHAVRDTPVGGSGRRPRRTAVMEEDAAQFRRDLGEHTAEAFGRGWGQRLPCPSLPNDRPHRPPGPIVDEDLRRLRVEHLAGPFGNRGDHRLPGRRAVEDAGAVVQEFEAGLSAPQRRVCAVGQDREGGGSREQPQLRWIVPGMDDNGHAQRRINHGQDGDRGQRHDTGDSMAGGAGDGPDGRPRPAGCQGHDECRGRCRPPPVQRACRVDIGKDPEHGRGDGRANSRCREHGHACRRRGRSADQEREVDTDHVGNHQVDRTKEEQAEEQRRASQGDRRRVATRADAQDRELRDREEQGHEPPGNSRIGLERGQILARGDDAQDGRDRQRGHDPGRPTDRRPERSPATTALVSATAPQRRPESKAGHGRPLPS